jgi:hypothetical protein
MHARRIGVHWNEAASTTISESPWVLRFTLKLRGELSCGNLLPGVPHCPGF